jgi:rod shape-determining protein MreC
VNAGKKDNVQIGQAVMSDDGLVGHVILTSSNSSRVLRLDDLNSRIPVMSARSQSVAILAGDNRDDPRLLYVDEESDWEEGDIVMTSGDAGRLPRGLNVGRVISAEDGTLRVKITGLQRHLDWVWIAQFKPIALPLDEVVDSPETEIEIETETENVAIPNGEQTSLNGAVLTVNEGATSEPAVLSNE